MIVLNITTASHGLRPARDLRAFVRTPPHRIQTSTKSSHGTTSSIFASGSFLASSPVYRFRKIKKSHLTHEHPSRCQQIVNPILKPTVREMAFLEVPLIL